MPSRFLNNININDSYTLPPADGTADQIIKTDGLGELSFIDQGDIVAGNADRALSLTMTVKNSTGTTIPTGSVVCFDNSVATPSGNIIPVKLADNNGTDSMPAVGVTNGAIADDAEGIAIMFGKASGFNTSSFSTGDALYVSDTPGTFTTTKPTDVKYIQRIGIVVKVHPSNGTIEVFGAGRVNDVPTPLYIDHANQRLGIVTTNPDAKLHVDGSGIFGQSHDNTTIGTNSFKTGEENIASGAHAVAINDQNTASGQSSFSFGNQNVVSGLNSAAGGQLNVITSEESFAFGLMCKDNQAGTTGTRQILLGTSLTPPRSSSNTAPSTQIVVGKFNNDVDQPPTAFVVGTGTGSSAKQNSLAVSYSGQVRLEKVATFSHPNDASATAGGIRTGGLYQKDGVVLINRGGGSTINPVSPQTTGTWTPQILADTPSEWVISSYTVQQGRWVRTKNLVQCDFTIRITKSNISGYVGGTSKLSIQGWPYNHDSDGDLVGGAFSRLDGFDVESKGNSISEDEGLGNVKLNILKQDSSVTTYFITTNMQPNDLNNGGEIFINGSFSYTTNTTSLNSGATINS